MMAISTDARSLMVCRGCWHSTRRERCPQCGGSDFVPWAQRRREREAEHEQRCMSLSVHQKIAAGIAKRIEPRPTTAVPVRLPHQGQGMVRPSHFNGRAMKFPGYVPLT